MQDAKQLQWVVIARMALRVARKCVSTYSCVKSRHDFTQPQLLGCLILKQVTKNDYRGVCQLLTLAPALREALGCSRSRIGPRFRSSWPGRTFLRLWRG